MGMNFHVVEFTVNGKIAMYSVTYKRPALMFQKYRAGITDAIRNGYKITRQAPKALFNACYEANESGKGYNLGCTTIQTFEGKYRDGSVSKAYDQARALAKKKNEHLRSMKALNEMKAEQAAKETAVSNKFPTEVVDTYTKKQILQFMDEFVVDCLHEQIEPSVAGLYKKFTLFLK